MPSVISVVPCDPASAGAVPRIATFPVTFGSHVDTVDRASDGTDIEQLLAEGSPMMTALKLGKFSVGHCAPVATVTERPGAEAAFPSALLLPPFTLDPKIN